MDDPRLTAIRDITASFDAHDLDRILRHFAHDAVFESPRGPDPWGTRVTGREAIRQAFAARFAGIPDVRYHDEGNFVADDRGVSQWTLSGTSLDGERIEVRGCDLWTFREDKVVLKDSYWKLRQP